MNQTHRDTPGFFVAQRPIPTGPTGPTVTDDDSPLGFLEMVLKKDQ